MGVPILLRGLYLLGALYIDINFILERLMRTSNCALVKVKLRFCRKGGRNWFSIVSQEILKCKDVKISKPDSNLLQKIYPPTIPILDRRSILVKCLQLLSPVQSWPEHTRRIILSLHRQIHQCSVLLLSQPLEMQSLSHQLN